MSHHLNNHLNSAGASAPVGQGSRSGLLAMAIRERNLAQAERDEAQARQRQTQLELDRVRTNYEALGEDMATLEKRLIAVGIELDNLKRAQAEAEAKAKRAAQPHHHPLMSPCGYTPDDYGRGAGSRP